MYEIKKTQNIENSECDLEQYGPKKAIAIKFQAIVFLRNRARSVVHVGYNVARERAQIDRRLEKMHFIKFHIIAQLELNQKYIYLHF